MQHQARNGSVRAASTSSSRASDWRAKGIIDVDEDEEDEDEDEESRERRSIDREYPRLATPFNYRQAPLSTFRSRQSTSKQDYTHSPSPSGREIQRVTELERLLRVAEEKAKEEQKNREMAEREVRDLQSSLYAPVSWEERKRKRTSEIDDDLDGYLLQHAIKQSVLGHGDDGEIDLENHMLRYAIKKSRKGLCSVLSIFLYLAIWLIK